MKEKIKLPRELLASFLHNVDKSINGKFPENRLEILNTIKQLKEIKQLTIEQDNDSIKNNKFKQTSFL